MEKSKLQKATTSQQLYNDVIDAQTTMRKLNISLGNLLKKLKGDWKNAVGDGVKTWREFLAQPEIGLTEHEASVLIKIHESVGKYGLQVFDIPTSAMKIVLKYEKDGEKVVREMLSAAQVLPLKELKELRHETKTDNAPQTYKYVLMKKSNETGNLSMVHKVKNDDIISAFGDKLE